MNVPRKFLLVREGYTGDVNFPNGEGEVAIGTFRYIEEAGCFIFNARGPYAYPEVVGERGGSLKDAFPFYQPEKDQAHA